MALTRTSVLPAILLGLAMLGTSVTRCSAAQISEESQEPVAIDKMSCGELEFIFGDEAQEVEASYLAIWAYGVKTGAESMDFENHPITEDGLAAFVAHLMEVCDADSDKLFVKAILE
jgi:hypothetical protein